AGAADPAQHRTAHDHADSDSDRGDLHSGWRVDPAGHECGLEHQRYCISMMIQRHALCSPEAGFTLLEMLVVLSLIAITASIALPLLGRPSDRMRLQSMVGEIVSAFRLTREAAILRNAETSLVIDVDRRTVQPP